MQNCVHRFFVKVLVLATLWLLSPTSFGEENSSSGATGMGQRIPWTTSHIVGSPDPESPYRIEKVFSNLRFHQPTVLTTARGSTRWYLAELAGKIYSFPHDGDIQQDEVVLFADLSEHLESMSHIYGMTFHPDFQRNRYVYICYHQRGDVEGGNHVSQFQVTGDDPPRLDSASEQLLLKWHTNGHNGSCLKFGPDGCLYISTGDGGAPSPPDPYDTGQDISDFRSSILRIDVDRTENGRPYAIPADNPFVNQEGVRPEIWAYGFRNPWRMNFDPATGDLWAGDVGWDLWEMVFRVESGGNYGWSIVEGGQSIRTDLKPGPTPISSPVLIHPRSEFRSITGGYVYHGKKLSQLKGAYIYGDFVTGKLWGLRYDGEHVTWKQELVDTRLPIITFAVDHDGELYIVDYGKSGDQDEGGTIYRLASNEAGEANRDFPRTLSDTGLFSSVRGHELTGGVIPYSINAEPWADGAVARRAVAIPNREQLGVYKENQLLLGERADAWSFPINSVLLKTLSLDLAPNGPAGASGLQPVETQVLHKDGSVWRAYTYAWNEAGTDASLVPARGVKRVLRVADPDFPGGSRQQTWHFHGRSECIVCHNSRAGFVLGFHPKQLSRDHDYEGIVASQLGTLSHIGLFADSALPMQESLVSPGDTSIALERRARSYLDVNCAHCHGNGGGGTAQFRLQHDLSLEQTGLLSSTLTQGDFGIHAPRVLVAGDPFRSVLYYRMAKLGRGHMPHMGSRVLDEQGLQWIHDWISELPQSPDVAQSTNHQLAAIRATQYDELRKLSLDENTDQAALEELLQTPGGGMTVQHGMLISSFTSSIQNQILATAAGLSNPHVRELFVHFILEEERPRAIEINPTHVLGLEGNFSRGERLFLADTRLQCRNCHQVGDQGKAFGPNLTRIGHKYQPNELLASMLVPSQKIAPEYVAWLLLTNDGTVHSGLLVERTAEHVVLRDSQGKVIRVPAADIDEMIAQNKSLMPADVLRDMSPEEVADLLAYLTSLK